jgi:hypothetical protein
VEMACVCRLVEQVAEKENALFFSSGLRSGSGFMHQPSWLVEAGVAMFEASR